MMQMGLICNDHFSLDKMLLFRYHRVTKGDCYGNDECFAKHIVAGAGL